MRPFANWISWQLLTRQRTALECMVERPKTSPITGILFATVPWLVLILLNLVVALLALRWSASFQFGLGAIGVALGLVLFGFHAHMWTRISRALRQGNRTEALAMHDRLTQLIEARRFG